MAATPKWTGDRLPVGSAGDRQVVAQPATKAASPPIQVDRWFRNGKQPNAAALSLLDEAANQATLHRTKEVFTMPGAFAAMTSGGAGDRARWRFAFHSGVLMHSLYAIVVMDSPSAGFSSNTSARLDITNGAGTVVATQTFQYGVNPTGSTSSARGWQYYKLLMNFVDGAPADTDLYGTFYDVDNGIIQSATVFELQSLTETFGGYLPQNIAANSAVLDVYRENLHTMTYNLWRRAGATVQNWTVNDGTAPITTASATLTNIVDTSLTGAPTAATPGYTLNMSNKDRVGQTSGIPCIMKAYGKISAGTGGTVYLKDSSNNTIASCTGFGTTAGWISSGAFNLPATSAKYDLQFAVGGGATFSLYAVSAFEYET